MNEINFVIRPVNSEFKQMSEIITSTKYNNRSYLAASILAHNFKRDIQNPYKKLGDILKEMDFQIIEIKNVLELYPINDEKSLVNFFNKLYESSRPSTFSSTTSPVATSALISSATSLVSSTK